MATLGWKAGTEQYPPTDLLDYVVAAEQAGFDMVDASDHFHPWSEDGQASFVWSWLGAAAARTSRIVLGPGVTCPILRYHPSIIAQAAATTSALSAGRFYLAVGTGEALNEYAATSYWPEYRERQGRLAEALALIRALWTGEEVSFRGQYYETEKSRLYTMPSNDIPIYISSLVPESAEFAGLHGDGLITVGGMERDVYRQILDGFQQGVRASGRDPSNLPRMVEIGVDYTDDSAGAIQARKQYWAGTFIPALFAQRIYTPKMSAQNGMAVGEDVIRQRTCISADPDEHVRFAQRYLDLGFDHLVFHSAGPDQQAFIEGYGRDVLPRLRQGQGLRRIA